MINPWSFFIKGKDNYSITKNITYPYLLNCLSIYSRLNQWDKAKKVVSIATMTKVTQWKDMVSWQLIVSAVEKIYGQVFQCGIPKTLFFHFASLDARWPIPFIATTFNCSAVFPLSLSAFNWKVPFLKWFLPRCNALIYWWTLHTVTQPGQIFAFSQYPN